MAESNVITALGLDLGRSGKTAFSCLAGPDFRVRQIFQHAISSISAPEVEKELLKVYALMLPQLIVLESNGPGGVFAEFAMMHNPGLPIFMVDTSTPGFTLSLWDEKTLSEKEFLNIRAEMYWIVRLLLRDSRLKFGFEDPELFAQLSSTRWDADKGHGEKIKILPKSTMKINYYHSELEGNPGSRSPDKADALALSALAYALLYTEQAAGRSSGEQQDEIIDPLVDGMFPIGMTTDLFEE